MTNDEMIKEAIIRYSKFNQGNNIVYAESQIIIHVLTYEKDNFISVDASKTFSAFNHPTKPMLQVV